MHALNLKQDYKPLITASSRSPKLVDVPCLNYLRIDGAVEPGHSPSDSPLFNENIQALYSAAYTLKFMLRKREENPVDYPVMPLEGQWWVEDGCFDINIKDNWFYTLQIMQPDLITPELLAEALASVRRKKGDTESLARIRLESFKEGTAVQMMHIGPYSKEPETMVEMDTFIEAEGLRKTGHHHEIYIGDPMRADPSKLKTILRHPVRR